MSTHPGSSGTPSSGSASTPSDRLRGTARSGDERVRRSRAYCSATDRKVPVLLRRSPADRLRSRPSYRDAERLVCLDYGVRCTGYLCPLFDVPTLRRDELREPPGQGPT